MSLLPSRTHHTPLALWHLLSLDAPTVATLWTWFIAYANDVVLPFTSLAAMFVAVWLLYAADRLLDARALEVKPAGAMSTFQSELELRHYFHHEHRPAFLVGIAVAGVLLAAMLPLLPATALQLYAILGALLIAWFLLIHTRLSGSGRLPKELAVGVFFPAAVFIPTIARAPQLRLPLLFPAALFAAVCSLNCLFLYAWEHPAGSLAEAHWTTRRAVRQLPAFAVLTAITAGVFAAIPWAPGRAPRSIAAACALSALLLFVLHQQRSRLLAVHLRAAADVALLTPVFWVAHALRHWRSVPGT